MVNGTCLYCPDYDEETIFPCDICPNAYKSECNLYTYFVSQDEEDDDI